MKLGFVSLGCPKNLVDGEVMLGLAREAGHEVTADARTPRSSSSTPARSSTRRRKNRSTPFSRWRSSSATASCKRLVVTGCLAERYRDQLKAEIPEIDVVLGTGEVPEIVGALNGVQPKAAALPLLPIAGRRGEADRSSKFEVRSSKSDARTADLSLRRRHAAPAHHAAPLRLREDRRRLRLHVRVLHHPDAARQVPEPRRRLDRGGGRAAGGGRRARAAADFAGHDVLRHRSRRARRAGAAAPPPERRSRASPGSGCSTSTRRRSPTTCSTRWRSARRSASTSTCRCSTRRRTCCAGCAGPAIARPTTSCWRASGRACPASRCARRSSSASLARPSRTSRSCWTSSATPASITSASSPTRTRKTRARSRWTDDVPADVKAARRDARHASAAARSCAARLDARVGERVRVMVDGPSPESELVLTAPARRPGAGHRRDGLSRRVRPVGASGPASCVDAVITGARGYDLIVTPQLRPLIAEPSAPLPPRRPLRYTFRRS